MVRQAKFQRPSLIHDLLDCSCVAIMIVAFLFQEWKVAFIIFCASGGYVTLGLATILYSEYVRGIQIRTTGRAYYFLRK